MSACRLGCDSLFELGYVVVARDGTIGRGPRRAPMTDDLQSAVEALEGKKCSAWDDSTERYFAHHRLWQKQEARRFQID